MASNVIRGHRLAFRARVTGRGQVTEMLTWIRDGLRAKAKAEIAILAGLKAEYEEDDTDHESDDRAAPELQYWDKLLYSSIARGRLSHSAALSINDFLPSASPRPAPRSLSRFCAGVVRWRCCCCCC
eukprot:573469-Rhodomonas_salina.1